MNLSNARMGAQASGQSAPHLARQRLRSEEIADRGDIPHFSKSSFCEKMVNVRSLGPILFPMSKLLLLWVLACVVLLPSFGLAQTISWAGREWKITNGRMAGVAPGDPANVKVDASGYLHLQIVQREGNWTASEVFSVEKLGFGTYQWVVEGDVYNMDKSTVLGLFPYGPAQHIGADAENEIDIEFSQWNETCHGCNADFTVYPSTGNRKPKGISSWEDNFRTAGGNITTARMEWSSERIVFTLMNGIHAIGTTADVIKTETYSSNPANIPQEAMPVGINLWCFKTLPAKKQSVLIRDFQFVPR
jgi:hypothetical protein